MACSGSDGPGSYVEVLKSETFASPTEDSDDASVGTPTRHLPSEPLVLLSCPRYGFNRQYSKVLGGLREELWGVVKLPDPDATPEARRQEVGTVIAWNCCCWKYQGAVPDQKYPSKYFQA